jgi:hypothetical protein
MMARTIIASPSACFGSSVSPATRIVPATAVPSVDPSFEMLRDGDHPVPGSAHRPERALGPHPRTPAP